MLGGVAAELSGGSFLQGAVQAGLVTGLNHVMHSPDGDDPIQKGYKGKKQAGPETPFFNPDGSVNKNCYNCHSYAWDNGQGDPTDPANFGTNWPKWDNDPTNSYSKARALSFEASNRVGDRVVYFAWDASQDKVVPTHSGIVTKVVNGKAVEITSKWGFGALWTHHPRDIPSSYGSYSPIFRAPNDRFYSSRIYYRP